MPWLKRVACELLASLAAPWSLYSMASSTSTRRPASFLRTPADSSLTSRIASPSWPTSSAPMFRTLTTSWPDCGDSISIPLFHRAPWRCPVSRPSRVPIAFSMEATSLTYPKALFVQPVFLSGFLGFIRRSLRRTGRKTATIVAGRDCQVTLERGAHSLLVAEAATAGDAVVALLGFFQ